VQNFQEGSSAVSRPQLGQVMVDMTLSPLNQGRGFRMIRKR
jgi:hypothetical protein